MSNDIKRLIKGMQIIKKYCENREGCEGCPLQIIEENIVFGETKRYCQAQAIARELSHMPCACDIDEIADIMNR